MSNLNQSIVSGGNTAKGSADTVHNNITNAFKPLETSIPQPAETGMPKFVSAIQAGQGPSGAAAQQVATSTKQPLEALPSGMSSIGSSIVSGLAAGLQAAAGAAYAAAAAIASNIKSTISSALAIGSPSKVMIELGRYVIEGFKIGMEQMARLAYLSAEDIATGVVDTMSKASSLLDPKLNLAMAGKAGGVGVPGGTVNNITMYQDITSPKPLSASEMTRETRDMLQRAKWMLP
jgi:hypothetical protein